MIRLGNKIRLTDAERRHLANVTGCLLGTATEIDQLNRLIDSKISEINPDDPDSQIQIQLLERERIN